MNDTSDFITLTTQHRGEKYSAITVRACKIAGVEHVQGEEGCYVYLAGKPDPFHVFQGAGTVIALMLESTWPIMRAAEREKEKERV